MTLFLPKGIIGSLAAARTAARAALAASRSGTDALERRPLSAGQSAALTDALLYLDDVSVSLRRLSRRCTACRWCSQPGEMRAIIGPNGAGKTTMMDVITGKTRPDTGEVVFRRASTT